MESRGGEELAWCRAHACTAWHQAFTGLASYPEVDSHVTVSLEEFGMAFYNQISDLTNFIISFTSAPKGDFGVFAKGYTLAANRLSQSLLDALRFSDYEAYPVVFLYGHALELSLKHIIYSSVQLVAFKYLGDVDRGLQNSHDLIQLSGTVKSLLALLFPKDKELCKFITEVTEACHEFSEIDPRSDGYRYPIDSKGRPSTNRHQVVNLRAFAEHMSSVLDDLQTVHFGLNVEADMAEEVYEVVQGLLISAE
jgi:hypothetical protein